ncbi:MAG TPA: phosphoenolpyruvate--protein phosphotransferase [Desulfobacteraceae bacterium]|nr:phosphoenolpyruvate--protein phosphotransferase [Desulfobacteraceae bacterium]
MERLKGISASQGIVIGKAHVIDRSSIHFYYHYLIKEEQVKREIRRFKEAIDKTREQIERLKENLQENLKSYSYILDSHLLILKDKMFIDATVGLIEKDKINAEWALSRAVKNIEKVFDEIKDQYIKERYLDVKAVADRIMRNLSGYTENDFSNITQRVIIVAHDLSPVDTSEMDIGKVIGFITDVGGKTSHTSIIAQALNIPAVVGLKVATTKIGDGDLIILDGYSGEVIISPDDSLILAYQEKKLNYKIYESQVLKESKKPALTLDGHRINVMANIEFLEEVVTAKYYGAEGIGLYRTEFHYLRSKGLPDEEELFEDYREVAELVYPSSVVIRTLDLGGDKFASHIPFTEEINPALGLRAIRLCLQQPHIFKTQLRAILRASAFGNIKLMFPMISGVKEIIKAREILQETSHELEREGIEYDKNLKVGIMIEVPSAVMIADILARYVDFFSIGTNDLIQYALAIDRINEQISFMYRPYHPSLIRMLFEVVQAASRQDIEVSLCGEMAGDPLCIPLLLGLGITDLSMNPGNIPIVKSLIRAMSMEEVRQDLESIMDMETAEEVKDYLYDKMSPLLPKLVLERLNG